MSSTGRSPPARFVAAVAIVITVIFLLAYARSFLVKPASDDWPIVTEMQRGNLNGVSVFFTDSVIRIGYRPLKSLAIWAMGNLGGDNIAARVAWIRAMHLVAAIGYMLVGVLWIRSIGLGRAGTIAMIAIMLLHPVLPQAAGSIDGIDTLASSALLWLGAWCVYRFRDRPGRAIATSVVCFLVGVGFKENLFALPPLALVVILMSWNWRARPAGAIAVLASLGIAALAMIYVRFYVISGGLEAGSEMIRVSVRQLAENTALFASGLLFFGDTIWVYVHQSKLVLALVGASCLLIFGLIVGGLWRRGCDRWTLFALIGLVIASFPTILLYHVSEMYVPPMLLPFALLCAMAVEGWMTVSGRAARFALGAVGGAMFASSLGTIWHKINGLADVGERADRQLQQVLDFVPRKSHGRRIMLLFAANELPPRRTYSVFRMGDEILLVHAPTTEWYRPGAGHYLQSRVVDDPSAFDTATYNLVLRWDSAANNFVAMKDEREPSR